ncbi:MAG TPA: hypothetical protein VMM17_10915 [Gemmatimonadaceae bacterium]|nr:hypothetical protein [Gemmatimonadaceae bacterium]
MTLFGGVRASWRRVLSLDYTMGRRINALLQWEFNCAELNQSVNVNNHSLALIFTPPW